MDHVQPLLEKAGEMLHVLGDAHLRGAGVGSGRHFGVELVKGHGLAEVVEILHAVEGVVEADIADAARFKMLFAQIGGGAAAENIAHGRSSFRMIFMFTG